MEKCWFLLPNSRDIKTIEKAWTRSEEIKDVQNPSSEKILIYLHVQYRKDGDGALIQELTYLALTAKVAKEFYSAKETSKRNELYASGDQLEGKLGDFKAWSQEDYIQRYANGKSSVICVTASPSDTLSDRVVISFDSNRETIPYARRLDAFIKSACENPRGGLHKIYAPCFLYTRAAHPLTVNLRCILDPSQDCVFINTEAMTSGVCAYTTNSTPPEADGTSTIRYLAQMLVVLWKTDWPDREKSFHCRRSPDLESKMLLWIASDPQWDLYNAIKSTLTMPGMDRVYTYLASYRKVLLRHECGADTWADEYFQKSWKNTQSKIQQACKGCDVKWEYPCHWQGPGLRYHCDED